MNCNEVLREEAIPALGSNRIPGDVNDDGRVDIHDALLVFQYDAGWNVTINQRNADVNEDGRIDTSDALLILQYSAGEKVVLK